MSVRTVTSKLRRIRVAANKAARCARAAHRALHVAELAILVAEVGEGRAGLQTLKNHCAKAQDGATDLDKYSTFLAESAAGIALERRSVAKLTKRARARRRRLGRRS